MLIGGDWAGGKPDTSLVSNQSAKLESNAIPTATTVSVDAATKIDASAKDKGDGGKVILWSDQTTSFAGTILALGGAQIRQWRVCRDVGKARAEFYRQCRHARAEWRSGTLLLDPADLTIGTTTLAIRFNAAPSERNLRHTTSRSNGQRPSLRRPAERRHLRQSHRSSWNAPTTLTLIAFRQYPCSLTAGLVHGTIINTNGGSLVLHADSTGTGTGTVI